MARPAARRWLPTTLRAYRRGFIGRDVLAGLVTGTVVIPQALAYASIADLPVEIGLYTCMLPMAVYACLGGSHVLSVSTTSTIAVLVATAVAGSAVQPDSAEAEEAVFTLTLLVGGLLLLARLLRLGSVVENISTATLTGVKIGVGLTVAATQLPKLLGVPGDPDASGFFDVVRSALADLPEADLTTAAVSVAAVATLLVLRHVAPTVPAPLVVVAAAVMVVALSDLEKRGVALVDPVPRGLPGLSLPEVDLVTDLLPGALAIALMAFLETVAVGRSVRRRGEPQIDSDRELLAIGVASVAGGLTQCLPPAGGFSQTAVNQRAGARTQAASLVTAALAVLVALLLAPVLNDLPQAILAALVLVAVLGLIDVRELERLRRIDPVEFWVALVTATLGLTAGLLAAVAAGVALTLGLVLHHLNQSRASPLYPRRGGGWTTTPADAARGRDAGPLLLRLDGNVYTGTARPTMQAVVRAAAEADPRPATVVLDCAGVDHMTVTLVDMLRETGEELERLDVGLAVAAMSPPVRARAHGSAWFTRLEAAGRVHDSIEDACAAAAP